MDHRCHPGLIAQYRVRLAVVLATVAAGVGLACNLDQATAQTYPCLSPEALALAGLLAEAEASYRQLLASDPGLKCAEAGLMELREERRTQARAVSKSLEDETVAAETVAVVAKLVRRGQEGKITAALAEELPEVGFSITRALLASNYESTAVEVLAATIKADPGIEVPEDLRGLDDAAFHLAVAEALADVGLDEQADTQLQSALESDPGLAVPDELAEPNRRPEWWRERLGELGPVLRTAGEIAIAFFAAMALLLLVPLLLVRLLGRFRARLAISPFKGPKTDDLNPASSAAVRERYGYLREQQSGLSIREVTASGESVPGPPKVVVDAYPPVGVLAALIGYLNLLLPTREREVNGYLRPRGSRGAGLNLTLARMNGKVFEDVTVWESDFATPLPPDETSTQEAYDRLGIPAAAWLLWAGDRASPQQKIPFWRPLKVLNTTSWRSYAQFAYGSELQRSDLSGARYRYLEALRDDPGNHGAMFNLSAIEILVGQENEFEYEQGSRRLEVLGRQIGDKPNKSLWYQVRYNQVAALLHPTFGTREAAAWKALELAKAALDRLSSKIPRVRRRTRQTRAMLKRSQGMILVALASALLANQQRDQEEIEQSRLIDALRRTVGEYLREPEASRLTEFPIGHQQLVTYVLARCMPLGYLAEYNLACYFARRNEFDLVDERLRQSIELGGSWVGEYAKKDPVFEAYLRDPARLARLQGWIDAAKQPPPPVRPVSGPPGPGGATGAVK